MSPEEDNKMALATDSPASRDDSEPGSHDRPVIVEGEDQRGIQNVEAVTLSWTRTALIVVFINIWFIYFVNAMQNGILGNLTPYAASDWSQHSLVNVISVVSNAISAATYVPLSKILDVWGRAEGFAIMVVFATLGLILMAVSHNLATFCAASVFYQVGFGGMTFCVDVLTADISQLKNRGLAYAFTSSPYIITAFAGPKAAEGFYEDISWRWGFGCFAIIFPIVAMPLFGILKVNVHKAKKVGTFVPRNSGRNAFQSVWHYVVDFDALGVVIFSTGLVVFLLPFDIASSAPNGWASGYIIAMIVVGFLLLVSFAFYEKFLAPQPLLNYTILTDRTVLGACLLDATYQIAYYCWDNYFTSYLQVVNDVSISEAGYINNTFNVVSGVLLLVVGYLMRRTGRFKWMLYIAVPLYILAQGLMIYFRRPNQSVGYQIMCQVFISIGGSVFIIVQQVAVLAAVDHHHVAAALALLSVVGTIGGSIGGAISGAIWTNTFPNALERYLPASAMDNFDKIYEDLETQLSYPVGSETRLAIQQAYGYAQTRMLAAGTGVMALCFIWTWMIRNINLKKVTQVKGTVF
ncbi:MFS siderochrome iron transporter MirB [Diaporthe helianthi]|uniref:MFS siderochrome iron transporter MirB n=1 Tax=Diaporthe helianthi TaxID=158607 RepID=A0A2P5IFI8_DIAHE|nr:MFS siderochrome iron transporter MirB [Diaporthe helianthi]